MRNLTLLAFVLLFGAATCRADSLGASDIVSWNLTVTDGNPLAPSPTVALEGPLSGNNSVVEVLGSDLTSTATGLFFNYGGTDGGLLLFQFAPLGNGSNFWCNSSANLPLACSTSSLGAESVAAGAPSPGGYILPGGVVEIANGGTRSGSDIVYNVDQTFTSGGYNFSVVGTITTDGVITTTPEPSALSLLALGVALLAFLGVLRRG
jgi:hypothetical protein